LPPAKIEESFEKEIIEESRKSYGRDKKEVEEKISIYTGALEEENKQEEEKVHKDLYDAQCEKCGKKIKVPFIPDPTRPIYCKNCLGKNGNKEESSISLERISKNFIPPKKEKREAIMKKIDVEGLRDIIKKAKEEKNHKKEERGNINPGETIKF